MKPTTPLQSIVDPFVTAIGGELVSSLIGNRTPLPKNADYLFRNHNVIVELKALEDDSFGEPFRRKLTDLAEGWCRTGRFVVYGTRMIETDRLPPECRDQVFKMMAAPLQRQVVTANKQIEATKELLGIPDAKGLLWFASDGDEDLQPSLVWPLLTRILQKKQPDGRLQYSHIDGLAYFNPRMLAQVPGVDQPAMFWYSGARPPEDPQILSLQNLMCREWPRYAERVQRIKVTQPDIPTVPLGDVRFFGVPPTTPRISLSQPLRSGAGARDPAESLPKPKRLLGHNFLDSNALDCHGGPEEDAMTELLGLREQGTISLLLPYSVKAEIEHPNTPHCVKERAGLLIYSCPTELTESELEKHRWIRALLQGNADEGKHGKDAFHLVESAKYGGRRFLTNDKRVLRKAEEIRKSLGMLVLSPSNFLERFYEECI